MAACSRPRQPCVARILVPWARTSSRKVFLPAVANSWSERRALCAATRDGEPGQTRGRFQTGGPGPPVGEPYPPEWIGGLPFSTHGKAPNRQHQLPLGSCRLVNPFEP